ncbi:MAG TPA: site-2 protease family protein, partial [Candidatus Brocadiia bacterium]|nr:site-2 protease family protein [Candidatus Brocadiia bacterium]
MELVGLGIAWYVVFLLTTTAHEAAHALAGRWMGDPTASHLGLDTLDPRPHMARSPFGMVVVPILTFVINGGGWMIGWASVPYDGEWALDRPRKAGLMSLAGPLANLTLAAAAMVLLKAGLMGGVFVVPEPGDLEMSWLVAPAAGREMLRGVATVLSVMFSLSLILGVFNLIPAPPLDGSGVVAALLPIRAARDYLRFIRNPNYAFIGIVAAWSIMDRLFLPVFRVALRALYGGVA